MATQTKEAERGEKLKAPCVPVHIYYDMVPKEVVLAGLPDSTTVCALLARLGNELELPGFVGGSFTMVGELDQPTSSETALSSLVDSEHPEKIRLCLSLSRYQECNRPRSVYVIVKAVPGPVFNDKNEPMCECVEDAKLNGHSYRPSDYPYVWFFGDRNPTRPLIGILCMEIHRKVTATGAKDHQTMLVILHLSGQGAAYLPEGWEATSDWFLSNCRPKVHGL
jgi:hypothetical protein